MPHRGRASKAEHVERKYSDTILLRYLVKLETGSWSEKRVLGYQGAGITFKTRAERKAALEAARAAEAAARQKPLTALNGRSCPAGPSGD